MHRGKFGANKFSPATQRQRVLAGGLVLVTLGIMAAAHLPGLGSSKFAGNNKSEQPSIPFDQNISETSEAIFSDDKALYSYVKKFGPKKTVLALHNLEAKLGDCHTSAHKAGRFSYDIYAEQAFKDGSAECHAGLYHGATEAYFKKNGTANLAQNLQTICSYGGNDFFSHQCLHGVGHGLMAWTGYELPDALQNCDKLPSQQSSCYTGVFMENIVGGLAEEATEQQKQELGGHFTKYLSDDPQYPCNAVDEKYKGSCYFMQTSRTIKLFDGDFAKVAAACQGAPAAHQFNCFSSMGRDIGSVHRTDDSKAIAMCGYATAGEMRIGCLNGAVQDSFWDPSGQDVALAFCAKLSEEPQKKNCYDTIFERGDFLLEDGARPAFCGKAETPYRADCRRKLRL